MARNRDILKVLENKQERIKYWYVENADLDKLGVRKQKTFFFLV